MNKIPLLLFLILSFSVCAQKKNLLGIKAGFTSPGAAHAGGIFEHSFNKHLGFAGEILFNEKNINTHTSVQYIDKDGYVRIVRPKYAMNYVQVPVNIKVYMGETLKPYFMAGLAAGYVLYSSHNIYGAPVYKNSMRKFEGSYLLSIGMDYKHLLFEVRYNAGFNSALQINNGERIEQCYNRNIMISVGLKL